MHISACTVLVTALHLQVVLAAETIDGFEIQVPVECQNLTYCTVKPANYPSEQLKEMYKDYQILYQPKFVEKKQELTFNNRLKDLAEKDNCEVEVKNQKLYMVRPTKQLAWLITPGEPQVRVATCKNEGAPCFTEFPAKPYLKTSCVQKYTTYEVMVKGTNQLETTTTKVPSCCSCYYKREFVSTAK